MFWPTKSRQNAVLFCSSTFISTFLLDSFSILYQYSIFISTKLFILYLQFNFLDGLLFLNRRIYVLLVIILRSPYLPSFFVNSVNHSLNHSSLVRYYSFFRRRDYRTGKESCIAAGSNQQAAHQKGKGQAENERTRGNQHRDFAKAFGNGPLRCWDRQRADAKVQSFS